MSASSEFTGKSFRPKGTPTTLTSGTGTFTPPVDGTWYRYSILGSGGGGAGGNATNGGGGGGAGEELTGVIKIPIAGFSYQVSAGGAGGASNAPGSSGGVTFLGLIRADGGRGGTAALGGDSNRGVGGIGGGSKNAIASVPGGAGGSCNHGLSVVSGSPGMPAGYPTLLVAVVDIVTLGLPATATDAGGAGGSSMLGAGGAGGASAANGSAASGFGGGGGAGGKGTTTGGAGSGGRIYLEPLGVW